MKNTATNKKPKRPFENDGVYYTGELDNGNGAVRVLCFRNRRTGAVGASRRFSREEAWRKSRRELPASLLRGVLA